MAFWTLWRRCSSSALGVHDSVTQIYKEVARDKQGLEMGKRVFVDRLRAAKEAIEADVTGDDGCSATGEEGDTLRNVDAPLKRGSATTMDQGAGESQTKPTIPRKVSV